MFLPIGDSPSFKTTSRVTWSLIAVNVVVFRPETPFVATSAW